MAGRIVCKAREGRAGDNRGTRAPAYTHGIWPMRKAQCLHGGVTELNESHKQCEMRRIYLHMTSSSHCEASHARYLIRVVCLHPTLHIRQLPHLLYLTAYILIPESSCPVSQPIRSPRAMDEQDTSLHITRRRVGTPYFRHARPPTNLDARTNNGNSFSSVLWSYLRPCRVRQPATAQHTSSKELLKRWLRMQSAEQPLRKFTIIADSWNFLALTPRVQSEPKSILVYYPEIFKTMLCGI